LISPPGPPWHRPAFTECAGRDLLATGVTVRKRAADDQVAAAWPPLVSAVSTGGELELALSTRGGDVDHVAAVPRHHLGDDPLGLPEEPSEAHPDDQGVVLGGVVSERPGNEYAALLTRVSVS